MRRIFFQALLLLPSAAAAQSTLLELQPGVRVRVTAPPTLGSRYDATIGARKGDTLSLVRAGHASIDVPISALAGAEVYRGKDRVAGMWNGVKWGVPIGLALGALAALGSNSDLCNGYYCDASYYISDTELVVYSGFGGAFYGAIIGLIVGRHTWEGLTLPNESASLMLDQRGTTTRLGLRLTF